MTYTDNILSEARKIVEEKNLDATIHMNVNGLCAYIILNGERKDFPTPKLAKIYLQNYDLHDSINADRIESGIVSQKTDEVIVKRRGRPKKADNDRSSN